jgi:hypothetical protein
MGNFFSSHYDLFRTIASDPETSMSLLSKAIGVATRKNESQAVKDACMAIVGHEKFDSAFDEVNSFFEMLNREIGVGDT